MISNWAWLNCIRLIMRLNDSTHMVCVMLMLETR